MLSGVSGSTEAAPVPDRLVLIEGDAEVVMLAGVHHGAGSRVDVRGDDVPWDGSAAMTKGSTVAEDAPWWELTGYSKHAACLIAARSGDRKALDELVSDLNPLVWHVARSH